VISGISFRSTARGVSALTSLRREVEGGRHVVEIRRAEARIEDGKLKIRVEAVVDGVENGTISSPAPFRYFVSAEPEED